MIVNCACKHEYQDEVYGPGRRLANQCGTTKVYRCTVCDKEHSKSTK